MRVLTALAFLITTVAASAAQAPPTSFEAGSVKPVTDNRAAPPLVVLQAGGRLSAPRTTLKELVRVAYGVEPDQVIGGPSWIDHDTFEIIAKAPAAASRDDVRVMLQSLLKDRFRLAVHEDLRDLPVYLLESAAKAGPEMRPANGACTPMKMPAGVPPPPPPPPPPGGDAPVQILGGAAGVGARCGALFLSGWVTARNVDMTWFAYQFGQRILHRRIVDRTGWTGNFDIDLVYTPDDGPMMLNGASISGDAPALSTAMREQLGLKLTASKRPLQVVVIDRAEPPTEN